MALSGMALEIHHTFHRMDINMRFTLRRYLQLFICCLFAFIIPVTQITKDLVSADVLPSDEVKAINQYPHWATSTCGTGGSSATPTDTAAPGELGKVFILGDSIMYGAYYSDGSLKKDFAKSSIKAEVDAQGSRSIKNIKGQNTNPINSVETTGMEAVDRDTSYIKGAGTVVVELGTNEDGDPGVYKQTLNDLLDKIKGINDSANLYLVNIFSPKISDRDARNKVIKDVAAQQSDSNQNVQVIDTNNAEINNKPVTIDTADDVHPSVPNGYDTYSQIITNALKATSGNGASASGAGAPAASTNDTAQTSDSNSGDISNIVKKYGLQSAIVKELDGKVVAEYQSDKPPASPASTMKLVIADTVLQEGVPFDKRVSVTNDLFYDGSNDLGVSSISVGEAMTKMLQVSSNVGANVLMKSLGGTAAFTQKAKQHGYSGTDVKAYYSSSAMGQNKSTIADQANAMDHIFATQGTGYSSAQSALRDADDHYHVGGEARKWAGNSLVAGDVALFDVSGSKYIVGVYYNGNYTSDEAASAVADSTKDLVAFAGSQGSSASDAGNGTTCCSTTDAGNAVADSKGADGGIWNSGLKPPYILEQWAIEVLKDLAAKKGKSATDAVTQQHVIALVAFAIGEGGDIANQDLFNPLNTGLNAPELLAGANDPSGVQSFKSFDAGVEAAARTFAESNYSHLASALLNPGSNAKQFMYALSYNWKFPGGTIWAGASLDEPAYYQGRLSLVSQVSSSYKDYASIVIGTPALEQAENVREPSLLQFGDGGGDPTNPSSSGGCASSTSGDATAIVQTALDFSWPDDSHGTQPKPAYAQGIAKYNKGMNPADCGVFVATVMRASGADPDYPPVGTAAQEQYVRSHSDKYDVVDSVSSIGDLQPGDILIVNAGSGEGANGHTWIYVGKQPPNGYDSASASLNSRAGNLGQSVLSDSRGNYLRARLK